MKVCVMTAQQPKIIKVVFPKVGAGAEKVIELKPEVFAMCKDDVGIYHTLTNEVIENSPELDGFRNELHGVLKSFAKNIVDFPEFKSKMDAIVAAEDAYLASRIKIFEEAVKIFEHLQGVVKVFEFGRSLNNEAVTLVLKKMLHLVLLDDGDKQQLRTFLSGGEQPLIATEIVDEALSSYHAALTQNQTVIEKIKCGEIDAESTFISAINVWHDQMISQLSEKPINLTEYLSPELLAKWKAAVQAAEAVANAQKVEKAAVELIAGDGRSGTATPVTDAAKKDGEKAAANAGFLKKLLKSEESNYEKIHFGKATGVAAAAVALGGGAYMLLRDKPENKIQSSDVQLQSRANQPSQGAVLGV